MENHTLFPQKQAFSTPSERASLAAIASVGLLSAISTSSLLVYIAWNAMSRKSVQPSTVQSGLRSFIFSSLGFYLISLLFCDLLQGTAFALNYHWARLGSMSEGTVCTVQGVVSQIGDLGAALWSTVIAFHTFWLLFLVRHPHPWTIPVIFVLGWTILIFLPIIGPTALQRSSYGYFFGLTGAWCWIGNAYKVERVLFLYAWVFLALGTSFIFYSLIYLRFSNFLTPDLNGALHINCWSSFSRKRRHLSKRRTHAVSSSTDSGILKRSKRFCFPSREPRISENDTHNDMASTNIRLRRIARRIMWYPIVYAVVVIPVCVCRMAVLAGWQPPFGLFVFAGICFGSSGES
ncbi:hypothetical protein M422DRAFT_250671 [Sphaerobolus stellatus SS14]|uniref:Unplaced genomic scaffold SPHSTscaffold_35, whole genome shotgun sequence n=1 Tax=Sphaerobolus stellatus (strain SS14) TaxID=990650 RepID=A0A0C9W2P4_SPHS4|nr:hypothetical protein M422DRAFT_250671 [Sphaerobolus stellatus SS14]